MGRKWLIGTIIAAVVAFAFVHSNRPTQHSSSSVITSSDPSEPSESSDPTSRENSVDSAQSVEAEHPRFAGDPCTSDCSGHEAGYNWAEEHGIDDEDDCDTAGENSNSPSFAEGCKAYVNGESPDEDDDQDNDSDN